MTGKGIRSTGTALALLGLVGMLLVYWLSFFWVSTDRLQGVSQRIFYIHVPAAWTCFLAFGIAFELPVLVFFLSLSGVVTAKQLLAGTPYAVLAVFVTAALLTPPDWVSQIFLAIPMIGLYLLGVAVAYLFGRRKG